MSNALNRDELVYFLSVIRSSLLNEKLTNKPLSVSWNKIYNLAQSTSLLGLCYFGLLNSDEEIPENLLKSWKRSVVLIQARQFQMDQDRAKLLVKMEENKLESICLKGITMSVRYPKPEMRQMADNDILYRYVGDSDRGKRSRSHEVLDIVMNSLGAKELSSGSIVDAYQIGNYSLFEMHRDLWEPNREFHEYFRNIWNKAKNSDPDHPLIKVLDREDQFVLMVAHSYKHKALRGCGPREIVDYYIFITTEKDLNWKYIMRQIDHLGLNDYVKLLDRMSECVFGKTILNEEDWIELEAFISAGTYGTAEEEFKNNLGRMKALPSEKKLITKVRYLSHRFRGSAEYNCEKFPILYKHRLLRWFIPFARLGSIRKEDRRRILKEITNVIKIEPSEEAKTL